MVAVSEVVHHKAPMIWRLIRVIVESERAIDDLVVVDGTEANLGCLISVSGVLKIEADNVVGDLPGSLELVHKRSGVVKRAKPDDATGSKLADN